VNVRVTTKVDAAAGDTVCCVEIQDGNEVIARGLSIRGGAGLNPHDARSTREHLTYAALDATRSLFNKAKAAEAAVIEFLHGKDPQ
jgi:hypothetical protein